MITIDVDLGSRSYPVLIGPGALRSSSRAVADNYRSVVVVTEETSA